MKLRLQITKDLEIRFVSHLDYLRALERSLRRSQLPVAYSEGFNPHIKFSLASALGVGIVSAAEYMEVEMDEPVSVRDAVQQLEQSLPRGIKVLAADATAAKTPALMAQAALSEYQIFLPYTSDIPAAVTKFNLSKHIIYKKNAPKRKEGFKEVDIKKFTDNIDFTQNGTAGILHFFVRIYPEGSVKAADVLQALGLDTATADIRRLSISREGGKPMLDGREIFINYHKL